MEVAEFQEWSGGIARLSRAQRRQTFQTLALSEASDSYDDDDLGECREVDAVTAVLGDTPGGTLAAAEPSMPAPLSRAQTDGLAGLGQRRVDSLGCPHCGGREVTLWGKASGVPRYRCKSCGRTFNALTKTPLAHLRKKDKWLEQAGALIDGASVSKAAERCDVDYTTAFRWRHRFLEALSLDKPKNLSGIVEGDETFILESFKGKRSGIPRATIDAVLPKLNRASLTAALGGVVTPANQFCCDGGTAIVAFALKAAIPVHILAAPGKPSPQVPDFHINNVNAYHGRLKEWMRRFHGVATKNLPNYLGWRRALEALGPKAKPEDWILGAIGLGPYQQITP